MKSREEYIKLVKEAELEIKDACDDIKRLKKDFKVNIFEINEKIRHITNMNLKINQYKQKIWDLERK